jgi:hypothetical protein
MIHYPHFLVLDPVLVQAALGFGQPLPGDAQGNMHDAPQLLPGRGAAIVVHGGSQRRTTASRSPRTRSYGLTRARPGWT